MKGHPAVLRQIQALLSQSQAVVITRNNLIVFLYTRMLHLLFRCQTEVYQHQLILPGFCAVLTICYAVEVVVDR